jgi:hypothetical protein
VRRSETEIVTRYADLIGEGNDPELILLVRDLDTGLTAVEPPASLWVDVPSIQAHSGGGNANPSRWATLRWVWRLRTAAVAAVALMVVASITIAASNILNLGRPTSQISSGVPLSGFHHVGTPLRSRGRAEVLFIGTQTDVFSAMERWPVVKSLEQFGTLHGVTPLTPPCPIVHASGPCLDAYPTYNWAGARYVSRYVDFVHKDVVNVKGHPFQRLTHSEAVLLHRYGPAGHAVNLDPCNPITTRSFPILLIDGYVETVSNTVICADFMNQQTVSSGTGQGVPLSFGDIRSRIAGNAKPTGQDVNAEANIITALICHADHMQPKRVCGRPVVREIMKYVR